MKAIVKRLVTVLSAFAMLAITGTGCKHTAHGAGQDIENMGEKIKEKTN